MSFAKPSKSEWNFAKLKIGKGAEVIATVGMVRPDMSFSVSSKLKV